jgi:hypothetical protein
MSKELSWKPFGNYSKQARVSIAVSAIVVVFVAELVLNPAGNYEPFMSVLAFASAGVAGIKALKTKAYLGFLAIPLSLVWLNPILGGDWFDSMPQLHLLAHAAFATLFGVYAFTFMRMSESKPTR